MKNKVVLLFLCFAIILLVSCEKSTNNIAKVNNIEEIDIPVFSDFELCKTLCLDKENILLCYYKQRMSPDDNNVSKIILYDSNEKTYTELYNEQLSNNSFYDICFEFVDSGLNIYKKFYTAFFLKYDIANDIIKKEYLNYNADFAVNISDNSNITFGNDIITVYDANTGDQENAYNINMSIVDYALNRNKNVFAAVDDVGNIILFDYLNQDIQTITVDSFPQGLVCYTGIEYTTNDDLIVVAACEDSEAYQIINSATGNVKAEYSAPKCELVDSYNNTLLFVESDRVGKNNGKVVAWNYDDNTIETLFNMTDEYNNAYIVNSSFNFNKDKILITILDNGKSRLLISDLANLS